MVADVCLVLEGTYPYVHGGVAEWTHRLISALPERTFHLWCLTPRSQPLAYPLPPNVQGMTEVELFAPFVAAPRPRTPVAFWDTLETLNQPGPLDPGALDRLFGPVTRDLSRGHGVAEDVLIGHPAFDRLIELYGRHNDGESFLDFLYTIIEAHLPLIRLMRAPIPPARLYHAASTGYAGLLAARAHRATGRPMYLTEHGIYTLERQIEILLADWIHTHPLKHVSTIPEASNLKQVWIDLFRLLGRITYAEAQRIFTLFDGNARIQRRLGAPVEKIEILPNGIDLERFRPQPRPAGNRPLKVGLVGRVVAIKDIHTFIRACRVVHDRLPETRFAVIGPGAEEVGYQRKCLDYRHLMGLDGVLEFTGAREPEAVYRDLDVSVLTSISEGLPLTVLESMASEIPLVCTRVGACPELLSGGTPEDRRLGEAGLLADVGDHEAVGRAIITLLTDEALRVRMGRAGRRRVARFYDQRQIVARYGAAYAAALTEEAVV